MKPKNPIHSSVASVLACAGMYALSTAFVHAAAISLTSPDESIEFQILQEDSRLSFSALRNGEQVVPFSPMEFTLDGIDLTEDVVFLGMEHFEVDETFPWRGNHTEAINRYNGARIAVRHRESEMRYELELRAFDDGVAFRYLVPEAEDESARIPDESTTFNIPENSTVWYHDMYQGHYEGEYTEKPVAEIEEGEWGGPPVVYRLADDGGYVALTEAALVDYSGMALEADGQGGFRMRLGHAVPPSYPFELRFEDDIEAMAEPAEIEGAIKTPWRVALIAADLNALVNSDVINALASPPDESLYPDGLHTEWIRPGRAVWRYLDGGDRSFEGMKQFTRWAHELGFEHHIVEGHWTNWSEEEMREITALGDELGVGIWIWRHSRNLRTPEQREAFFSMAADRGIAGVKLDFFDHEHRDIVKLYQVLLEDAAKHELMVNFHGSNKPTGEVRTWPNELIRESVKGMEYSSFLERAWHGTVIPFTRFVAGHGDYTPVHFGERRGDTTWAHQIASAAVFLAPLQTFAAHPETMLEHKASEMIRSIRSAWDETRVLPPSEIGEVAVFARRSGDDWFLAILNSPAEARTLEIPLDFLDEGGYEALIVRDTMDDPADVVVENGAAGHGDVVTIELEAGGGYIARYNRP